MKYVIIGGVAAGMSAASKIRRSQFDAEVIVYEMGNTLSYGACGMPYFISDVIEDENKLIARTKEEFESMGIICKMRHQVLKVIPQEKTIHIKNLETNEMIKDQYDKLLIATGANSIVFPWPNKELEHIVTLKTLNDAVYIKEIVSKPEIKNVIIIGAGFIGVEMVEAMIELKKQVTLIELQNQILPLFDKEITQSLEQELKDKGADLRLGEKVIRFEGQKKVEAIITDKNYYKADIVLVAVGVKPNVDFIEGSGIHQIKNGAIIVDEEMKTNVKDIYAAGDVATVTHLVHNSNHFHIPLGTNANKQGRIAGENMIGVKSRFPGALGTTVIKVCDLEAAKTGISEKEAIFHQYDFKTAIVKANNHASYYPDPEPMVIKVIYNPKSLLLYGAQIVGKKEAAIRINMFALAIHNKMTTDELGLVDFAYAPPFAGVWDAVHIAANQAKRS
jgi:NADPH-dependent 2,4-dienoyl-CoA reductase/sulfur reductase-like enzyme